MGTAIIIVMTMAMATGRSRVDVNRRQMVKASPALLGAWLAPSSGAEAAPHASEVTALRPDLPRTFSTAERDRRWQRVRDAMKRQGLDGLITPASGGEADADSRYLTQRPGWVVFPAVGPVTLVGDSGDRGRSDAGVWADEVVPADDGRWSPAVIEALRKSKMSAARIGIGRLSGVPRNLEGDVSATTLERVREALPAARFESAAELMLRVKLQRSAEEIAVLEKAAAAGEWAIEVLMRSARPGRRHLDVWAEVFTALTAATGEPPARLALRAGDEANTSGGLPLLETLASGQLMNEEIAAQVLGHMAQVNHSFCVGSPAPADWDAAARYCADVFQELVEWIKPGRTFMDLCRLYAERARARSPELQPRWVLVHTCGLGDGPRVGLLRDEARDLVIEPGMAFTLKPRILVKGARPTAQFGDPVVVTDTGARRLGRRRLGPFTA